MDTSPRPDAAMLLSRRLAALVLVALAWLAPQLSAQSQRMQTADDIAELPATSADWLVEAVEPRAGAWIVPSRKELHLDNGLVRRSFRLAPAFGGFSLKRLGDDAELLRAVQPEAVLTLDGEVWNVGGLEGQPNHAFLREAWLDGLQPAARSLKLVGLEAREITERLAWERPRHHAPGAAWPPKGMHLVLRFAGAASADGATPPEVEVRVHYELYDGLPLFSKWIEVENQGTAAITLDRVSVERLAVVEEESRVEAREGIPYPAPRSLHVETDFAFGGMSTPNTQRHVVHWRSDPDYASQVNYKRVTPCLLDVAPDLGPAVVLAPGQAFTSFRVFELVHDSSDRERRGLAQRRMMRTIAPWVTENPLMHHLRVSDEDSVRRAIEEAAEVGFELVILSFGSGFNIETEDKEVIARWKTLADLAHERGVELGGYSLLASRTISAEDDVVLPEGQRPTFGNSPCLCSPWGERYFEKLYAFFEATGFDLLEHDGSYPGDPCHSVTHPGHSGAADSRWRQWSVISDFYAWCRGRGISLNVPDSYYLAGSTKSGMGYREVNWSLPRADQVVHTRQNVYDGTWRKTPSMGWMFVPLSEYQGGGAAATIEPLDEHLDHYRRMLRSNLALGVQACYRGPRLFDTERTRDALKDEVQWFKRYREILESDLVHGRRADGRDVDWMLHVNPFPSGEDGERGMLVVFNPLEREVTRTLRVPLYYTGLDATARVAVEGGEERIYELARDYSIELEVTVPAQGMTWATVR